MKKITILIGIIVAIMATLFNTVSAQSTISQNTIGGTASKEDVQGSQQISNMEEDIIHLFREATSNISVHNAFFAMHGDSLEIDLNLSYGRSSEHEPYYLASIAKTFTATGVGMLVNQGKLSFRDPITDYLSQDLVEGLHLFDGKNYSAEITIAHLLNHTSGLPDYFEDQPISGSNMINRIFEEPNKFWEPEEIIEFTKANFKPHFAPGTDYHYTDTEYVLLGLIAQHVTGLELHEIYQKMIFEPLEMRSSWLNLRSTPLDSNFIEMAPFYVGESEVSRMNSLSADWAGGGLISTNSDLTSFMKALVGGELVSAATWDEMNNYVNESKGTYYGFGLRQWVLKELFPTLPDLTLIGHSGSTGSFMYYCPELDTYFIGSFNQTEMIKNHILFLEKVLLRVASLD
ncbi:MAG: serine hydrolase domain-containing protein [Cyclobacteriaceae bacterium]